MRRLWVLFLFLPYTHAVSSAELEPSKSYTLKQCFELALERSDSFNGSLEDINQAEARISQAQAAYLPTLSANASTLRQAESSSALSSSLAPSSQSSATVALSQNLFNGLKDMATLKSNNAQLKANKSATQQAKKELYLDVAQAFYNVLLYRKQVLMYREQIESEKKRRNELRLSQRAGRARESDIVSVDSSIATIAASLSSSEGLMSVYSETLSYLTGLPVNAKLIQDLKIPDTLSDLERWTAELENLPQVQKANSEIDVARENLKSEKGGYLPTLDLSANYYPYREGVYSDIDWDVTLSLKVPIFEGGLTKAKVAEANSKLRSKEFSYRAAKRSAEQSIRKAYFTLKSDADQLKKLNEARDLAEKSLSLTRADFRRGLSTSTEVLIAVKNAIDANRSADQQKYELLYNYIKLKAESGSQIGE